MYLDALVFGWFIARLSLSKCSAYVNRVFFSRSPLIHMNNVFSFCVCILFVGLLYSKSIAQKWQQQNSNNNNLVYGMRNWRIKESENRRGHMNRLIWLPWHENALATVHSHTACFPLSGKTVNESLGKCSSKSIVCRRIPGIQPSFSKIAYTSFCSSSFFFLLPFSLAYCTTRPCTIDHCKLNSAWAFPLLACIHYHHHTISNEWIVCATILLIFGLLFHCRCRRCRRFFTVFFFVGSFYSLDANRLRMRLSDIKIADLYILYLVHACFLKQHLRSTTSMWK